MHVLLALRGRLAPVQFTLATTLTRLSLSRPFYFTAAVRLKERGDRSRQPHLVSATPSGELTRSLTKASSL